jgi:hypothetical protein
MFLEESSESGRYGGGVFLVFLFFDCKLQLTRLNGALITDVRAVVRGLNQPPCCLPRLGAESAAFLLAEVNHVHGFIPQLF